MHQHCVIQHSFLNYCSFQDSSKIASPKRRMNVAQTKRECIFVLGRVHTTIGIINYSNKLKILNSKIALTLCHTTFFLKLSLGIFPRTASPKKKNECRSNEKGAYFCTWKTFNILNYWDKCSESIVRSAHRAP